MSNNINFNPGQMSYDQSNGSPYNLYQALEERVRASEWQRAAMELEINRNRQAMIEQALHIQWLTHMLFQRDTLLNQQAQSLEMIKRENENKKLQLEEVERNLYHSNLKLGEGEQVQLDLQQKLHQTFTKLEKVEQNSDFQQSKIAALDQTLADLETVNQDLGLNNQYLQGENQNLKHNIDLLKLELQRSYERQADFSNLNISLEDYFKKWS